MEESLTGETRTQHGRIPVHVMIRPRGGDFNYSAAEFAQMKRSIEMFKGSEGVDGFVLGLLTSDRKVAEERNRELVELAKPLPCTFHRAIDEVQDLDGAVETIIGCGFRSILTSGGAKSASEGADEVARLQKKFGERISLILGGGIRNTNVMELKSRTGVEWVHSAAITGADEEVDGDEVRRMVTLLQDT
jgi:copper homeostasis protein